MEILTTKGNLNHFWSEKVINGNPHIAIDTVSSSIEIRFASMMLTQFYFDARAESFVELPVMVNHSGHAFKSFPRVRKSPNLIQKW
jgi:uncharacterized membrane protein